MRIALLTLIQCHITMMCMEVKKNMSKEKYKSVRISIPAYEYFRKQAFDKRTSICKLLDKAAGIKSLKNNKNKILDNHVAK